VKYLFIILITLGFIVYPLKISAGQISCEPGITSCTYIDGACSPGEVTSVPCFNGTDYSDCCRIYYAHNGDNCPLRIDCLTPAPTITPGGPTPIPSSTPTPNPISCIAATSGFPLGCPNPSYTYVCKIGGPGGGVVLCCTNEAACTNKKNPPPVDIPPYNVCQSAGTLKPNCEQCMYGVTLTPGSTVPSQSNPKVWTAIGCIETEPSQFISIILKFGVGIAGGIAFLLILLGGFQVMTASGNPEQMNGGRELIGAAITGLILIIFSVLILKIIGVDILGIPGFG
jgi:hypothetical protein